MTQYTLATEVGINVSTINFFLKALVKKDWIKMGNFGENREKLTNAYLLTPPGLAEKVAFTRRFLQRMVAEYERLRGEVEVLQIKPDQPSSAISAKLGS